MSRELPAVVRAVAGLAATVVDEARRLPRTLPGLPIRAIGLAMQATMKLQQQYSGLVARGDEVFTGRRGEDEPGLATFDEDVAAAEPPAGARDSAFDRAGLAEDGGYDDELSGLAAAPAPEEVVAAVQDITEQVRGMEQAGDRRTPQPGLTAEDALETALLEADGAPDSALVDGGTTERSPVDPDLIAESPVPATPAAPPVAVTEDVATGVAEEVGDVDVITPDGEVATVAATVTDEGVAAPEAPEAVEDAPGAPEPEEAADQVLATDERGTTTDTTTTTATTTADATAGGQPAGAAPVDGYDSFTVPQLRGRLRGYQLATVQELLAYEEATRAREPYLRMLRNRLEKLERQAIEQSPLAPRGI